MHYYNESYNAVPDHAEGWRAIGNNVIVSKRDITPNDRWGSENLRNLYNQWLPAQLPTVKLEYGNSDTVAPVSLQILYIVKY